MDRFSIEQLIPQREPILMVDDLLKADGEQATACLTVRRGNIFLADDGTMEESGIIEHMAQSASAFAGYKAFSKGGTEAPVGYIGEVRKFKCLRRPNVGEKLYTTIILGPEVNGVTLLTATTCVEEEKIAETQMKIFIKPKE